MSDFVLHKPSKSNKPKIDYQIRETDAGVWRTFEHGNGSQYREFTSHADFFGLPMISFATGINPETNKRSDARGFIAIGWKASGVIAIGQFCQGYIAVGQFAVGRIAAFGQFALAPLAIGQIGGGVLAISQIGLSMYGIHQIGITLMGGYGQLIPNLLN